MSTYTYQDFLASGNDADFIEQAIARHKSSEAYNIAVTADLYDHRQNKTINEYVKKIYTLSGTEVEDYTASNHKLASNFFNMLNTQRCTYSLGNGISFVQPEERQDKPDEVKESLGDDFDHQITEAAYFALIHGISFPFWNRDRVHVFKLTEFVPLWDEHTGELMAGIRFWRLDSEKPMTAVLYTPDGYRRFAQEKAGGSFAPEDEMKPYITEYSYVPADESVEVIGEDSYGTLPIVPMWASRLKQSTLIGMRQEIDSYDLIKSGFANDMTDCAMIYWLVENYGGMTDEDLARFRDRLKFHHIADADTAQGGKIAPFTQEIPYEAREVYLKRIESDLYRDFCVLDVHTVSAGATNDHIDAGYQPMDAMASDFEYWVGEAIRKIVALQGVEDTPIFTRNRISNQKEQVEMVSMEAQWLDQQTVLSKLPNISPEERAAILSSQEAADTAALALPNEDAGA